MELYYGTAMRISRIHIENFRSIRILDLDIPQICCLVGPNSSGKSNILLAMQRVLGRDWASVNSFDERDVYAFQENSDVHIHVTFDPGIPFKKFKASPPVEIKTLAFEYTRYKVGDDKGKRRLNQTCLDEFNGPLSVLAKAPKTGQQNSYERLVGIPSDIRESIPFIYIGTNRSLREQMPSARNSMLRQLFEDVNRNLQDADNTVRIEQKDGSEIEVPRLERFQKLMEAAVKLLRTDAFVELENLIKSNALQQLGFDPKIDADKLDLFFSPFDTMDFYKSLDLRVREGAFSVSATELGEGLQNILVISILKAFETHRKAGAILLIEEPEMFLHPQMQRSLYKTLRKISVTNQIIYTTHSPHFVSVPEYEDVAIVRKTSSGTSVRRSNLPPGPKFKEKLIKELDPERSEMFFATRLLLVEGDTEKLALPAYASRMGLDLDNAGASVVEVGGKNNLLAFAQLATSFDIPVGVVYDVDSTSPEDLAQNSALDALATKSGTVKVWPLTMNYEDQLIRAVGQMRYDELLKEYNSVGKPTRARLIAKDPSTNIPEPIPEILQWLASKSVP